MKSSILYAQLGFGCSKNLMSMSHISQQMPQNESESAEKFEATLHRAAKGWMCALVDPASHIRSVTMGCAVCRSRSDEM